VGWKTQDFDICTSAVCWVLVPASKPSNIQRDSTHVDPGEGGEKRWMVLFVVIVVVLIVVAAVYIGLRWWRNRDQGGSLLKMYSSV
jgi:hypothetical protein